MFIRAIALMLVVQVVHAAGQDDPPLQIQRHIAVDNVCAWPNLTQLRDGTIAALLHNQPSHGTLEGDVECWTSADGALWKKATAPTRHDPHTIRMNHASGLARNGDLLVLCSGWTDVQQPGRPKQSAFRDAVLRVWVCRSGDGGRTWTHLKEFPAPDAGWTEYIPFGPIVIAEDGSLRASCYGGQLTEPAKSSRTKGWRSWCFRSDDDGKTWQRMSVIGPGHNETALVSLGGRRWLAAARTDAIELFRSEDDGATWQGPQRVTRPGEINAQLLRLKDGRLLLSYGNRVKGEHGVLAKLSRDQGKTWSDPLRLVSLPPTDCGYPSSVERADGKIVTAYYAGRDEGHNRYHMGVVIWQPPPAGR